jgi:hypothetical protein
MSDEIKDIFKNFNPKDSYVNKYDEFTRRIKPPKTSLKSNIKVIDPISLQQINTTSPLKSKGSYKKFINPKTLEKPCPPGKIRNPLTGRCIKKPPKPIPKSGNIKRLPKHIQVVNQLLDVALGKSTATPQKITNASQEPITIKHKNRKILEKLREIQSEKDLKAHFKKLKI